MKKNYINMKINGYNIFNFIYVQVIYNNKKLKEMLLFDIFTQLGYDPNLWTKNLTFWNKIDQRLDGNQEDNVSIKYKRIPLFASYFSELYLKKNIKNRRIKIVTE